MKLTKVFYDIRKAIHSKCPDCNGESVHWDNPEECNWCKGSGRKYRYIFLRGSSRSSKTTSLIQNFYSEAWNEDGQRFSVWRDTKKDCKDTVGNDMARKVFPEMPYYSPKTVNFNKTESVYTFPSKSVIEICGSDDEEKVHGYNGNVIWLNEPYNISRATFDQLDQRTEDYMVIDMNPKKAHWSDDLEKDPRCIVLHSTFKDNPYCPPEQKIKILSYQPVSACSIVTTKLLSESEAKAYNITENHKNFDSVQLEELSRCKENERKGSASAFNWSVYGLGEKAERPNRIFNWTEISDDDYNKIDVTRYYGVDWGVVDPWGILEAKYYDGSLYLKELNYLSENELKASLLPTELHQVNKTDEGLVGWMFKRLNIPKNAYVICDDNRPSKIIALRQAGWDYALQAIKGPNSIVEGISLLCKLKVYYTSSSKNLKYEQENYSRKVDRYGIVLEEPEDNNNHICSDPSRYIAQFLRGNGIIKLI